MSDFLSTLVARALHPSVSVRPQVLSLFEPRRESESEEFVTRSETPRQPATQERNEDAEPVTPIESLWGGTPAAGPQLRDEIPPHATARSDAVVQVARGSFNALRPRATHPAPESEDAAESASEPPPPLEPSAQAEAEDRSPDGEPAAPSLIESSPIIQHRVAHEPGRRSGHIAPAHRVQNARPHVGGNEQVIRGEHLASRPAEPSINVTIGRVEVRATLPPPSRAQATPALAAARITTLEEYLRKRAAGHGA